MNETVPPVSDLLRNLSAQDFLIVGLDQVAYIRPIVAKGQSAWALHAADGTLLTVQAKEALAVAAARQNDLDTVLLH